MILLDTNVVSETMKPAPHATVQAWFNRQILRTLFISSITQAEVLFGIHILPAGKRKDQLIKGFNDLLGLFTGRVLPFDTDTARHYAQLAVIARAAGRGFPTPDGYIAAIAVSRKFIVASRDTGPFKAVGVAVIDPWVP